MRRVLCLVLALCINLIGIAWAGAADDQTTSESSWTKPTAMALKRVSAIPGAQHESVFLNNVDCQLITYHLVNSPEMRSGCFTPTAFGMMDSGNDIVIFNGTDEGIPLIPKVNDHVLVPWPNASTLITLNPLSTGGAHIYLYSSPLAVMQNQRNWLLQLTAKKLTAAPDIQLKNSSGSPLIINPGNLAISDGGSWLIAETVSGSFIRINLATLDTKTFTPPYPVDGVPLRIAASDDGRYVAIQNRGAGEFRVYDLSACNGAICASHNYHDFVNDQLDGIKSTSHLRFVNRDLLTIEITATNSGQSGVYQLAPRERITSMTDYIGLGDSYTSGEGAFDYRTGTDTTDNLCHQSINSYPLLLTKDLFSAAGGHSAACSGARTNDVGSNSSNYRGQVRGGLSLSILQKDEPDLLESVETNFLPGYVAQHRFVKRWQPKIVTVSIGGNDVGFGDILQQCVMPRVSRHHSDSVCFNTYEDRVEVTSLIDRTIPRWTTLFNQLKSESPATQLYVIGYPDIIDDTGSCALNVNLGKSELEFAKELVVYLNNGLKQSADDAGVPYVDISKALVGHRLCETKSHNVAVNGLTAGRDAFVFGRESYHPNAFGHQLIEQEILRKTNNLTLLSSNETPKNTPKMLDAPKSGRTTANRKSLTYTSETQQPGGSSNIQIEGSLLKPNTSYTVRLDGLTGPAISAVISDAQGNVSSTITIPPEIDPGSHTIDVTGEGPTDEQIDITQPIYVPENGSDADGDGTPDTADSCPAAVDSGKDVDQDDTDDVCDPVIGTPIESSTVDDSTKQTATEGIPSSIRSDAQGLPLHQHILTVATTFRVNSQQRLQQPTDNKIYHGQGVGLNNVPSTSSKSSTHNSALQRSKRINYMNPWTLWWVYILLLPFMMLTLLKGIASLGSFFGRV